MTVERRNFPQFFITAPAPCPYLDGRMERKVFTHLVNSDAAQLHDALAQGGFRRSQNIAYRPACEGCSACISVRVPVSRFDWSRGFRRIVKRNLDIAGRFAPARASSEHYGLFRQYIDDRHASGGMADMTVLDFYAMVNESFVETRLTEYRTRPAVPLAPPDRQQGELVAVTLTDILEDGLSMIYSFFRPGEAHRSLGTFMILDHIRHAEQLGLPYLYLGYWVNGSDKMNYKARFLPQERLTKDGWQLVTR